MIGALKKINTTAATAEQSFTAWPEWPDCTTRGGHEKRIKLYRMENWFSK
jgi:hypothetical protein